MEFPDELTSNPPMCSMEVPLDKMSSEERRVEMLSHLSRFCHRCTMCELGRKPVERHGELRDPHVFSTNNLAKFMVVGQNPGWEEVKKRIPFVGRAGHNFNVELAKNGVDRSLFYITNVVKCCTKDNVCPNQLHLDRCDPILRMEFYIVMPKLVITLGNFAFSLFCPGNSYAGCLGTIVESNKYNVKVFPIYHPSPLNLNNPDRYKKFAKDMRVLCKLVKALT